MKGLAPAALICFFYFYCGWKLGKDWPMPRKEAAAAREAARQAVKSAWAVYRTHGWGYDFLKPLTLDTENDYGLGVTILDSLDTLVIMGLDEEYQEAKDWVTHSLDVTQNKTVMFFETVIRCLGGLIAAYELTRDDVLLERARSLGDRLMMAFNTPTGIPRALVNLQTGELFDHQWARGVSLLADVGTCQLEFLALTEHTGDVKYANAAFNVITKVLELGPLPPARIAFDDGMMGAAIFTFDAFGDSYYEYLLKGHVYAPKNMSRLDEFAKAIHAAINRFGFTGVRSKLPYFTTIASGDMTHEMSHLEFFLPGLLLLAARVDPRHEELYNELGNALLEAGMKLYATATGIGGETAKFTAEMEGVTWSDATFKLRPEFVESLFYAWRLTHKPIYRQKAKQILESILKYCRLNGAFTTVHDVTSQVVVYADLQDSFFFSETMKYLYLIFCDDNVIDLDKYVFTTQAHPLTKLRY